MYVCSTALKKELIVQSVLVVQGQLFVQSPLRVKSALLGQRQLLVQSAHVICAVCMCFSFANFVVQFAFLPFAFALFTLCGLCTKS